jgi:hypothetical protein
MAIVPFIARRDRQPSVMADAPWSLALCRISKNWFEFYDPSPAARWLRVQCTPTPPQGRLRSVPRGAPPLLPEREQDREDVE